jgi:hypothetical protein
VSILPGRHQVLISCSNAYVISAVMGNTDLLANPWISIAPGAAPAPIEVVAHHGGGTITGTIKLDPEPVGRTMFVLAIPRASTRDPELAMVSDEGGREFSFASLAPGEYTLYGLSTDQIEFRNPEFLRGLSGGESVHVEDGATATVTITRLIQ